MKKTYKIEVDCANCANKMEEAAKNTAGVKDAVVNFMTLKMIVEFEDGKEPKAVMEEILKKAEEIQEAQRAADDAAAYPEVERKPEITIDDFDKIQIQVGEVLKCEPVKKAKKLLVSQIRVGNEIRQIVSGIAAYYKPEEMVGKKVAVITNLKPCKLCGVESQGMILAAGDDEGNLSVMTVDRDIISGSEIC